MGAAYEHGREGGRIGRGPSRRRFLVLSGAGLAGAALLGVPGTLFGQTTTSTPAPDLGIKPNDPGAGAQNRANLARALSYSAQNIHFPAGGQITDYYIDNSPPDIVINNYGGRWTMESGTRLVFQNKSGRGLTFEGDYVDSSNTRLPAEFVGLRTTFESALPSTRVDAQECIEFRGTTDTAVRHVDIDGSAAAGLLFSRCFRPLVAGGIIKNTMADGLHFANCRDARADAITAENTGDDGVAFLNYDGAPDVRPDLSGGTATNITVRNAGTRGITVIGQRDVTIDGFVVDGTHYSGVLVAYEEAYRTRVPANILYANGTVRNAGRAPQGTGGSEGNKFGLEYTSVRSVEFRNVKVYDAAGRGVAGQAGPFIRTKYDGGTVEEASGTVTLDAVEVNGTPESGFDLGPTVSQTGAKRHGGTYYLSNLTARETGKTGMWIEGADLVQYNRLVSENTSKALNWHLAFMFMNNVRVEPLGGHGQPQELRVNDSSNPAWGYRVETSGAQSGSLGKIYDEVVSRNVVVDNFSGLTYEVVDG